MKCEELITQSLVKNRSDLSNQQLEHILKCPICAAKFSAKETIENQFQQLSQIELKKDLSRDILTKIVIPEKNTKPAYSFHFLLDLFKPTSQRKSIFVYGIMTLILVFITFIAIRHIPKENKATEINRWHATTTTITGGKADTHQFYLSDAITKNFNKEMNAIVILPMRIKVYIRENTSIIPYPDKLYITNGAIEAEIISNPATKPFIFDFNSSSFVSSKGKFFIRVNAKEIEIKSISGTGYIKQNNQKRELSNNESITISNRSSKNEL